MYMHVILIFMIRHSGSGNGLQLMGDLFGIVKSIVQYL